VHGGPALQAHALVDAPLWAQLEAAVPFAPLHTPATLGVIRLAQQHFPGTPQVACLDTVFHATMPAVARVLPIARALESEGIRRYGFHGLSCESVLRQLQPALPARLVIAHLGSGASITAVQDGRSIDTSMGLTPTGGAMMGTRSGDLDPGVLVYLMRARRLDADALEALVNREAGLRGVSRLSGDMRQLRAAAAAGGEGSADAALAVAMFCQGVRKQVAAMAASLGGIDALVFTGGIGENDGATRDAIAHGLAWMGRFDVKALPSQEDAQIALHAWACARGSGARG
jgi:acetate kinase